MAEVIFVEFVVVVEFGDAGFAVAENVQHFADFAVTKKVFVVAVVGFVVVQVSYFADFVVKKKAFFVEFVVELVMDLDNFVEMMKVVVEIVETAVLEFDALLELDNFVEMMKAFVVAVVEFVVVLVSYFVDYVVKKKKVFVVEFAVVDLASYFAGFVVKKKKPMVVAEEFFVELDSDNFAENSVVFDAGLVLDLDNFAEMKMVFSVIVAVTELL